MTLWQDIRFAVRLLAKDRWFTLVATGGGARDRSRGWRRSGARS